MFQSLIPSNFQIQDQGGTAHGLVWQLWINPSEEQETGIKDLSKFFRSPKTKNDFF